MATLLVTIAIEVNELDADDEILEGISPDELPEAGDYDPVDFAEQVTWFLSQEDSAREILAGSDFMVNLNGATLRSAAWEL